MNLRTGIDLVDIERLAELRPEIRSRFLERVFTPAELEIAKENNARLAGRFAAKEAVAKVLGTGIGGISWREIEVLAGSQGEPCLILHGAAQARAAELGLTGWSVSITHSRGQAAAVAAALQEG